MLNPQQGPHKGSYGYYYIALGNFPVGVLWNPELGLLSTWRGSAGCSKILTWVWTTYRLCSGVPWVSSLRLGVLIWNANFHHWIRPETAPRCPDTCVDRQEVSSELTSCLALYNSQFHHLATSPGPHACTCWLTWSQETLSLRLGLPPLTLPQRAISDDSLKISLIW